MIQRIQSVFLLCVIIFSLLFMTGTVYKFTDPSGQSVDVRFAGGYTEVGKTVTDRDILLLSLSVLIPVLAAVSIFLYRNRRQQLRMSGFAMVLDIILTLVLAAHLLHSGGNDFSRPKPGFRCIVPAINVILLFLAMRSIRKDDDLVKTYDRIR